MKQHTYVFPQALNIEPLGSSLLKSSEKILPICTFHMNYGVHGSLSKTNSFVNFLSKLKISHSFDSKQKPSLSSNKFFGYFLILL